MKLCIIILAVYSGMTGCSKGSSPSEDFKKTLSVSLAGENLTEVPRALIPSSVEVLDLSGNRIRGLTRNSLASFGSLVDLRLRDNGIDSIPDGVFARTVSLQILDLSGNNLTSLDRHTFRGAAEILLHLDLSNNRLENVEGAFQGMWELSRLDLRGNLLRRIDSNTFVDLINLRYLRLDGNRISDLDAEGAFKPLSNLLYLVLKDNAFGQTIGRFQFGSETLSYVDMSACELSKIPHGLPSSVTYLQLRQNQIAKIERGSLDNAWNLTILILDDNEITEVEFGAFEMLENLQQLWLNANRLRRLPRPLPVSLRSLYMDANLIDNVTSDIFPRASKLNTLSLTGNRISFIQSEALHTLQDMSTLDLTENKLESMEIGVFSKNQHLHNLQLARNPLKRFDVGCFDGLQNLKTLSMSFVPSREVDIPSGLLDDLSGLERLDLDDSPGLVKAITSHRSHLDSLTSVQELNMRNSELTELRSDFLDFFPNLVTARISSRRWICDRSIVWFRDWLLNAEQEAEVANENRCGAPEVYLDHSVISLSGPDFEVVSSTSSTNRPDPKTIQSSTVDPLQSSTVRSLQSSTMRFFQSSVRTTKAESPSSLSPFSEVSSTLSAQTPTYKWRHNERKQPDDLFDVQPPFNFPFPDDINDSLDNESDGFDSYMTPSQAQEDTGFPNSLFAHHLGADIIGKTIAVTVTAFIFTTIALGVFVLVVSLYHRGRWTSKSLAQEKPIVSEADPGASYFVWNNLSQKGEVTLEIDDSTPLNNKPEGLYQTATRLYRWEEQ